MEKEIVKIGEKPNNKEIESAISYMVEKMVEKGQFTNMVGDAYNIYTLDVCVGIKVMVDIATITPRNPIFVFTCGAVEGVELNQYPISFQICGMEHIATMGGFTLVTE